MDWHGAMSDLSQDASIQGRELKGRWQFLQLMPSQPVYFTRIQNSTATSATEIKPFMSH